MTTSAILNKSSKPEANLETEKKRSILVRHIKFEIPIKQPFIFTLARLDRLTIKWRPD
jgi:hypothetical protein